MSEEQRAQTNSYEKVALKRRKYKEDLKNNTLYTRKLYFLIRTMKELNYTKKELGEKSGISPTLLNWKIEVDDCSLKEAHLLLDKMGMSLSIEFKQKVEQPVTETRNSMNELTIQMPDSSGTIKIQAPSGQRERKMNISTNVLEKRLKEGGITRFIAEFIISSGLAFTTFCNKAELNYLTIRENLEKDDFKISQIYKIARTYNQRLVWNIVPAPC